MQLILKNIRALRIKKMETIVDMADNLKISVPRLSAIENSKIAIPDDFFKKLFGVYGLTLKERSDFVSKRLKITTEDRIKYMNRK